MKWNFIAAQLIRPDPTAQVIFRYAIDRSLYEVAGVCDAGLCSNLN
jgi:hypothetical protein